jgi:iron complex transport system permease protein
VNSPPYHKLIWLLLSGSLVLLFFLDLSVGSAQIPFSDVVKAIIGLPAESSVYTEIVVGLRLPKAVTCILVGAGLSLAGLLMQTLFRNPLAGPDVFGLSSGAGLAVALIVMAGLSGLSIFSIPLAASVGCASVFLLIFIASQKIKNNVALLIIGLMLGAATSSVVSILQFFTQADTLQQFLIWTFGSVSTLSWPEISVLSITIAICLAILFVQTKLLNGWLLGEAYAQSIGVSSRQVRILSIMITSVLTGAITSLCGPIAFVGLAVPHVTRILFGTANHRILVPGVTLLGSALMLLCDVLSNIPGNGNVLPINAITSLIGAPIVVWILIRTKRVYV